MGVVPFSQPRGGRNLGPLADVFGGVSILDRLDDFRKRLVRSLVAVALGALLGFLLIDQLVGFLLGPTRRALPAGTKLIYTQPGEAFGLYIQVALIAGVVFAMPVVMYQLWRLLQPLIPLAARRFAIPFVFFTTLGFVAGAAFTHYIAFPYMMIFFATSTRGTAVPAEAGRCVRPVHEDGAGDGRRLPDADDRLLPRQGGLVTWRLLWRSSSATRSC